MTGDETYTYVRGANLIFGRARYYLYNAHGDVVQLTNTNGQLTKNYNYDAFGNERSPDEEDANPFRYCGEYYDVETGLYYLRARYYNPLIGRFTQEDAHWNTANMIYGDNPQKINEREDTLGLKTYSYAPELLSIIQAGNIYLYAMNNPLAYKDASGRASELTLAWTSSMWWLLAVDGPLPIGDIIYGIGIAAAAAVDTVNYIGVDNIVRIASDLPDTIQRTFRGGSSTPPGDPNWRQGFKNFWQLKRHLGHPGAGNDWHHIVEQSQIRKSGFDPHQIHNTKNVIKVSKEIHKEISRYYSQIHDFTEGLRFRDWLAGKSFQEQFEWGIKIARMFGVDI